MSTAIAHCWRVMNHRYLHQHLTRAEEREYVFDVSVAPDFVAQLTSWTGDADLYVHFGAPATITHYDCRRARALPVEICETAVPAGESRAFVTVHAHTDSIFSLRTSYDSLAGVSCTPRMGCGDVAEDPSPVRSLGPWRIALVSERARESLLEGWRFPDP